MCYEVFTRRLTKKKFENFAQKRQVEHTSTVMELSIPFHTLFKLVDTENLFDEKFRSLVPPLEVIKLTSKLDPWETSSEMYDSKPQTTFKQTSGPNNKSKPPFRKNCSCFYKPSNSVSNCFRKYQKSEERIRNS